MQLSLAAGWPFEEMDQLLVAWSKADSPSLARFDATLAYHQTRYDIRLNLFNVTDKDHIAALITSDGGRSIPGIGRTLLATLTWRI